MSLKFKARVFECRPTPEISWSGGGPKEGSWEKSNSFWPVITGIIRPGGINPCRVMQTDGSPTGWHSRFLPFNLYSVVYSYSGYAWTWVRLGIDIELACNALSTAKVISARTLWGQCPSEGTLRFILGGFLGMKLNKLFKTNEIVILVTI